MTLHALHISMDIRREALLSTQLGKHEHLISLLAVTTDPQKINCLVSEYAPKGSVDKIVRNYAERGVAITHEVLMTVCKQIGSGMAHLRRHGFVHSGLTSRNVLAFNFHESVRRFVHVKISDYGKGICQPAQARIAVHRYIDTCRKHSPVVQTIARSCLFVCV